MKFRVPVSVLGESLPNMADFPHRESGPLSYDGPSLFVRGTRSKYVKDDAIPTIKKFFPKAEIADVEAGHWLISEKPEAFRQGTFRLFYGCAVSCAVAMRLIVLSVVVKFLQDAS